MKKLFTSVIALLVAMVMSVSSVFAATTSQFVQNLDTQNTLGYVDPEVDQFETYSEVKKSGDTYTSIASKIYKPVSGDTLIVCFHGNGEGGVDGSCNNYSPLAGNQMATTFISSEVQKAYHGAYVLAFQAPDYWYNDYTAQAKAIIDQAKNEFGIKQVFVTGLSAGGLMTERMLSKYGNYFSGALISCAAIAKNGQAVEGLGGDYSADNGYLDETLGLKKPVDYDQYVSNYTGWLEKIAESNVPMYLVHCLKDNTISYTWSKLAYETIKTYRDEHQLDGDIYFQTIESTGINKDTGNEMSGHWAWVKMYNNEISVNGISTLDWFESLSTSTNSYQEKEYILPTAGASQQENTYKFNLIAQVREDGEKVVAIEIDMNGQKVDASKLTKDMFKIKAYNKDAQADLGSTVNYGLFDETELEVAQVSVNERGNIVLDLAVNSYKGVLNWSGDLSRNLTTQMMYSIEPVALPIVKQVTDNKQSPTTSTNKKTQSVKTGDNSLTEVFAMPSLLSAGMFVYVKKHQMN